MPRFSANLGFLWPDRLLLERIDAAAAAGFKAIELHWPYDTPAADIKARCEKHDLTLLGINTPIGDGDKGDFGLGAQAGRESEFRETFLQTVAYAREAGASAVHVMAGVVAEDRKAEARKVFVENLHFAAANANGLTLLLEPINQRDKPGYFYSTISEAADIIADVGTPNLKIMFDVYHVGVSEGDITTRLERHLADIGHVQIAAVPSRAEPDEGEIAYASIFDTLDRIGWAGWTGCEYRPRGDTDAGLAWMRTLSR